MQTENKLNITAGEWLTSEPKTSEVAKGQTYFSIGSRQPERRGNSYVMPGFFYPHSIQTQEEMKANATLIADAGTTANKCGLLPSELLKQRDELMEALKELCHAQDEGFDIEIKAYNKAKATLQSIKQQ